MKNAIKVLSATLDHDVYNSTDYW